MMTAKKIVADVRVSDRLDGLEVMAREQGATLELCKRLRNTLGGVRVRRSATGAQVSEEDARHLLTVTGDVDLRWSESAELFARNRERHWGRHAGLHGELTQIVDGGRPLAERALGDITGLDPLDDHQWVNVAAMTVAGGCGLCVFDEQGAGKTVTFIFAFDVLAARDEIDFALILAPKSMVPEWPRDFVRFKSDLYRTEIAAGTRKEKKRAISSASDVLVTNFETAVSMEAELEAKLRRLQGRAVIVVDESFYAKNLDAKRTRAIRRLREWCSRAFVLCGTPAPNSPHDLIQQYSIVDFGYTFSGVSIPEGRAQALPVVRDCIAQRGLHIRHLKREVLPDLPGKTFHTVQVPMEPQQEEAYCAALNDLVLDLESADDAGFHRQLTSFLARRTALIQICSNPVALVPGYQETPAKLIALESLLNELIDGRGEKVVVWSYFTASIDAMMTHLTRFSPLRYDGQVSDVLQRRESVRAFQEDNDHPLLIANPAAAGAGLTLHRARFAVYESMSNQAAHYLQSLDRIHRRGQERPVEYLILLCDRTIDIQEYDRLTSKEAAAQQLLGDRVDAPVTRDALLSEALQARELLKPEKP